MQSHSPGEIKNKDKKYFHRVQKRTRRPEDSRVEDGRVKDEQVEDKEVEDGGMWRVGGRGIENW